MRMISWNMNIQERALEAIALTYGHSVRQRHLIDERLLTMPRLLPCMDA